MKRTLSYILVVTIIIGTAMTNTAAFAAGLNDLPPYGPTTPKPKRFLCDDWMSNGVCYVTCHWGANGKERTYSCPADFCAPDNNDPLTVFDITEECTVIDNL